MFLEVFVFNSGFRKDGRNGVKYQKTFLYIADKPTTSFVTIALVIHGSVP